MALTALLEGMDNPRLALNFVNNLVQAATNVASLSGEDALDAQFLRELVAFGFEYAKLNPDNLATATENGLEAFLATLWQSTAADMGTVAIRQATGKLSDLFEAMATKEERIKSLKFGTNLLKAVGLAGQELQEEKQDSKFLSALIELGSAYAALNPTTNSAGEPLNFFLDTLWQNQDDQKGAQELQEFIREADDPVKLLKFEHNLLKAVKQSIELQEHKQDVEFLNVLVELGRTYTSLKETVKSTSEKEPLDFFLTTLWDIEDSNGIQRGSEEFEDNFKDVQDPIALLTIADGQFKATKQSQPQDLTQAEQFIFAYRFQIRAAAQNAGLPEELVAGVLHDELIRRGWEDDIQDRLAQEIINLEGAAEGYRIEGLEIFFNRRIEEISFGAAQMQQQVIVELVNAGYLEQPNNWSNNQLDESLRLLADPTQAPFLIAARLKQTVDHWSQNGVDISDRSDVLATLYSIGLEGSRGVNPNPEASPRGEEIMQTLPRMREILNR